MDVKILKRADRRIKFIVEGVDIGLANALRRIAKNEIPILAIEEVNFEQNSSGLYDEMLVEKIVNQGSINHMSELPEEIRRVFVVSHDITPEYHLKMQAAFQKYCDNAVSKTVNFSHSATVEDVRDVYMLAYKLGCKGVTMYRDGSKDNQVLNLNINIKKEKKDSVEPPKAQNVKSSKCPQCSAEMEMSEGCCKCHSCGYSACSV